MSGKMKLIKSLGHKILAIAVLFAAIPQTTYAEPITGFDAGSVLSDSEFRDTASMSQADIQNFLNRQVPACSVNVCLKSFTLSGSSAAKIIHDTATLFSVNPQVILALLETEHNLVTNTAPTSSHFSNATGFPQANPTFATQVNDAAQFLNDTANNTTAPIYPVGTASDIPYDSSNQACTSTSVTIQNNATAALYSYPGLNNQPNAAALNVGYGAGDGCSSYGIRNFYIFYNAWFGNLLFTTPAYRFWSPTLGRHFYTASAAEKDLIISKWPNVWSYEGTAYNIPDEISKSAYSEVYRFWSNQKQAHFYTISQAERDMVITTWPDIWTYEGVAFTADTSPTTQLSQPVYRFWSNKNQSHFYTTNQTERDSVIATWPDIWSYEGIAYYVR